MHKGVSQNDIGIRTDVLSNIPKSVGMTMLIRSMAPQIICADEIGNIDDVKAIKYAVCSGIKGIFTAHGKDIEEIKLNPVLNELLSSNIIERVIVLRNDGQKRNSIVYKEMMIA